MNRMGAGVDRSAIHRHRSALDKALIAQTKDQTIFDRRSIPIDTLIIDDPNVA